VKGNMRLRRLGFVAGGVSTLGLVGLGWFFCATHESNASPLFRFFRCNHAWGTKSCAPPEVVDADALGGTWYWLRSPEQEKRVVANLYNRYCIRCHGVDGRGIWDIPGVPNFANAGWQATRSDGQLARAIVEGRGAVMPPFRGTLALEEAWAMARYLRSFVPGTEPPRPENVQPEKSNKMPPAPTSENLEPVAK
jgi:hypothetical protein